MPITDMRILLNAIIDILVVIIIAWSLKHLSSGVMRVIFIVVAVFMAYYAYVDTATAFGFMSTDSQRDMLLPFQTTLRFIPGGIALVLGLLEKGKK